MVTINNTITTWKDNLWNSASFSALMKTNTPSPPKTTTTKQKQKLKTRKTTHTYPQTCWSTQKIRASFVFSDQNKRSFNPLCLLILHWLKSTKKGAIQRSKDVIQAQQQTPASPTVTLTWNASKYKVHKRHERYIVKKKKKKKKKGCPLQGHTCPPIQTH